MAIKPRIHWAWDGTRLYDWYAGWGGQWLISSEQNQTTRDKVDGDDIVSDLWDFPHYGWVFQFADLIQIHSLKLRLEATGAVKVWITDVDVPNDYNPNTNPQWTQVVNSNYTVAQAYQELAFSPIQNAKWVLVLVPSTYVYCCHIFGEYMSPRFEFWNVGQTAEFNDEQIPFDMPNAPNINDYHEYLAFKIKNLHTDAHNYSLTVKAVKYGGDTVITNNYKLAKSSDGYQKSGTITLSNIAGNGGFSEELRVYADVLKGNNPADGLKHYFVIDVTETA